MIGDDDLERRLREGGPELWDRPAPPRLDLARVTRDPQEPPATGAAEAGSEGGGGWLGRFVERLARPIAVRPPLMAGGALACACAGIIAGAAFTGGSDGGDNASPPQVASAATSVPERVRRVALERFGSAPAQAMALAQVFTASDGRTIDVRVSGLPQPARGEYYELWALGDDGRMVSLGQVRVDAAGVGEARLPLPVSLRRFPVLDISLESADGDPSHSGHSVLRSAAIA